MWYNMELIKGLIKMLEECLSDFGFNKSQINHVLNSYSIYKSNKFTIYNLINSNNEWFISHGFSKQEIIKMVAIVPSIYAFSSSKIETKYNYFISFGYTEEQTHKIFSRTPQIIGLSIENIESKINNYNKLGIPKEDIIKMSLMFSGFYSISEDNVNNKIKDLINLGFTYEQVIKMIKLFPAILSLSIETIKEKIDFYRELNILDFIIENPKCLMQSFNLSYARYMFYLMEKNDVINSNTSRRLFVGDKQFSKQFKVTKKELLKRYSYEESRSRLC